MARRAAQRPCRSSADKASFKKLERKHKELRTVKEILKKALIIVPKWSSISHSVDNRFH